MFFFEPPIKPPTSAEYSVIGVVLSGFFMLLGLTGFSVRFFAAPLEPELAAALVQSSGWSLGIGLAIAGGYWLWRKVQD